MKRNVMVWAIAECLVEPHFPDDVEREADFILSKLERRGMGPHSCLYSDQEQWEPEDPPKKRLTKARKKLKELKR